MHCDTCVCALTLKYTCFFVFERVSAHTGVHIRAHLCECLSVFERGESHSCAWVLCLSYLCADGELRCLETGCDVYVFVCVCVWVG